jgi:hypothetical protein
MIVYHGTTHHNALKIRTMGFVPRAPSHRVWFARSRAYSLRRAQTKAGRGHDRPVVLTCELDIARMRERLGPKRVFYSNGIVAISGTVPVSVIRSHAIIGVPSMPDELATWLNDLLGLKPHKGVSRRHPGIERLSRWVIHHLASPPGTRIRPGQLLDKARQWLPEFLEGVEIDPEDLLVLHRVEATDEESETAPPEETDPREAEALAALAAANPKRRIRGLSLLADLGDPDLFDWCAMALEDEALDVRVAALRTMLRCEDGDPEILVPLADSAEKRLRAAAIAALARHSGEGAPYWFEQGLKDPDAAVRLETAGLLSQLDAAEHRDLFELALYDPNPQVRRAAQKLADGKGLARLKW